MVFNLYNNTNRINSETTFVDIWLWSKNLFYTYLSPTMMLRDAPGQARES